MVETPSPSKGLNPFSVSHSASQESDTKNTASHATSEGKETPGSAVSHSGDVKICAWPGCGKPCRKPEHTHCSSTCRNRWARSQKKESQNDAGTKTQPVAKNFLGEKVRSAVSFLKTNNPFAAKPFVAATDVENPENPFAAAPRPDADSIDGILFREAVCAGVKGTFTAANAITRYFAEQAELDAAFIDKLIKSLSPDPKALDDFVKSLDALLKKYNWKPKNVVEWTVAINFVRLMSPYPVAIMELRAEIKRKREEKKSA